MLSYEQAENNNGDRVIQFSKINHNKNIICAVNYDYGTMLNYY